MENKTNKSSSVQGKASREKGKRFERWVANYFCEHGVSARRTAQYCGKTGQAGDVEGVPGVHVECKAVEKLNLEQAYQQSVRDAEAVGNGEVPIVIHKRFRRQPMVTLALSDWIYMYLAWQDSRRKIEEEED